MKAKVYGPFSLREDLTENETALATVHGIAFICDEAGNDWYTLQKKFSSDTLKIIFDENGLINSASNDVSKLWPLSYSVAEVDTIPDTFNAGFLGGLWVFDGKKITPRIHTTAELVSQANATRAELLAKATLKIAPLQDAVDIDDPTDAELASLKAWKQFRVALNRLDLSTAPDIIWPEEPADVA